MEHDESYETLLSDHDTTSAHQNHKRFLAAKVYRSLNRITPESMLC